MADLIRIFIAIGIIVVMVKIGKGLDIKEND